MMRCVSSVGRCVVVVLSAHFVWFGMGATLLAPESAAQAQLIPMSGHREHELDRRTGILYIATTRGTVERYNTQTEEFMTPFHVLSTGFMGLSLTPDGSRLFVADRTDGLTAGVIRVFDTASGNLQNAFYTQDGSEAGAWDVAVTRDNHALFSTSSNGSGGTHLRALELDSFQTSIVSPTLAHDLNMIASRDGSTVLLQTTSGSPSRFMVYDADSRNLIATRSGFGSSISRDGSLIAASVSPTGRLHVLDRSLDVVADLGVPNTWSAFSPVSDILFITDQAARELVAIDLETFAEIERYEIGEAMSPVDGPSIGHMSFSGDGQTVYLSTRSGLRVIQVVPAPGPCLALGGGALFLVGRRRRCRGADACGAAVLVALGVAPAVTAGHSTLLPIPDPVDHVIDHARSMLYITTDHGTVERYDILSGELLFPIVLSEGGLRGIDLSPDGSLAYVADGSRQFALCRVWAVDLQTGESRTIEFPTVREYQVNAHAIVSTASGHAVISVDSSLTSEALYRLDFTTPETVTALEGITRNDANGLFRGGHIGNTIFFTEPGTSGGPIGVYAAELGQAIAHPRTGGFVSTVVASVSRDETRIAANRGGIISVFDRELRPIELLGGFGGGVAYSPSEDLLFAGIMWSDQIVVVDANSYHELRRICIGETLYQAGPLGDGVISVTDDNETLFISTPTGLRRVEVGPLRCEGDTNDDLRIDFNDLNSVLSEWGSDGASSLADFNRDCAVDFDDLNLVLSNWGHDCE